MEKAEIRKKIKEKKRQLTPEERAEYSNIIMKKLIEHHYFQDARVIYIYVSYNEEVLTEPLIQYILEEQISVAVPKIVDKKMDFYYIKNLCELKEGAFGILEPKTNCLAQDSNVLMIMPGLAFDINGNRIGYGGGYYDTYLEENKHCTFQKIGITYDFQVSDYIETENYDKKVDLLITEKRMINISQK